jgi:hypothetical protein
VRLVATEATVLRQLDISRLLARLDQFYWRGRIVQTLLDAGLDHDVALLAADYPGEMIFAIRRAGRADLLPLVRELTETHPDDPDVLTGAIQTVGIFGQTEEMLRASHTGRRLLATRRRQLLSGSHRQHGP